MSNGKSWISEHPWMTFFLGWFAISGIAGVAQVVFARKTTVSGALPPRLPVLLPYPFQDLAEEGLRRANARASARANETRGVG